MPIVYLQNGVAYGYHQTLTKAECPLECVEVDEIPENLFMDGMITRYIDGQFVAEPIPAPEKSLSDKIADLEEQLAVTNATVDFLLGI
jgi:hypothetical protein